MQGKDHFLRRLFGGQWKFVVVVVITAVVILLNPGLSQSPQQTGTQATVCAYTDCTGQSQTACVVAYVVEPPQPTQPARPGTAIAVTPVSQGSAFNNGNKTDC